MKMIPKPTVGNLTTKDVACAKIQILETTDLHMHILGYDYFADRPTPDVGLVPLAAQIERIRAQNPRGTFLFDNGDFLQGNPLADFMATGQCAAKGHPMTSAMQTLAYDAVALGNHEFNFGLDFLNSALKDATFDVVCANVKKTDGTQICPPYTMITRNIACDDGITRSLKIGVLGLVTPQIVNWDKTVLNGAIVTKDIVETARTMVSEMQAQGTDFIVALCHAGVVQTPWTSGMENAALPLAALDGIDVILTGHTHDQFPNKRDISIGPVDPVAGTLHGKPAVMAGFYGSHLGVVDLDLTWTRGIWAIHKSKVSLVTPDPDPPMTPLQDTITQGVMVAHTQTLAHIRQPFPATDVAINSHFALVAPNLSLEILAKIQFDAATQLMKATDFDGMPVLSAVAPFRAGGRGGPHHYIDIQAGPLTLRDSAAIYPFANRLYVVRRTGAQILTWLQKSAQIFATLQAGKSDQTLLRDQIPPYDFDVLSGLTYTIDIASDQDRIHDLSYQGHPVSDTDVFAVATNSYRANGGGGFFEAPQNDILGVSATSTRDILIDSLRNGCAMPTMPKPVWKFAPMPGATAVFETAPHATAPDGHDNIRPTGRIVGGFAEFRLVM